MSDSASTPPAAVPQNERQWGMFCHLAALLGYLMPFGHLIGPLVIWLIKKDEMPFVDDQGKESLNFQITMTLALAVAVILIFVVIGIILVPALLILDVVFIIIATVKSNDGVVYRYPFCLRLIK